MPTVSDLAAIAARFGIEGEIVGASRVGSGHINATYVSSFSEGGETHRYIHQAINDEVFPDVEGLMRNLVRVTGHLHSRAAREPTGRRWEVAVPLRTVDEKLYFRAADGICWRTFPCIENARTHDVASNASIAREAARGFGRFVRELADFDPGLLVESIPRFHDLAGRLARLRAVALEDPVGRAGSVERELESVWRWASIEAELADVRSSGGLPLRAVHNDTKVNNALLDDETGRVVAIIDLDTVMPGTLLFDFGDLVRTATCPAPEDETDPARVHVDRGLFRAVCDGYLSEVASIASSTELDHLLLGGRFMTLIVGVRFLTDHLEGDPYFGVHRPGQNLDRARTQLALLESYAENAGEMEAIVREVRASL